jgi:hypothetical protein
LLTTKQNQSTQYKTPHTTSQSIQPNKQTQKK